jgi:hypothetical protein
VNIQNYTLLDTISEKEYHAGLKAFTGEYECEGQHALLAPPPCPENHSTRPSVREKQNFYKKS